jgi:hypothetical protein
MTVGQNLCPHLGPPRIAATPLLASAELPPMYGDNSAELGDRFIVFVGRIWWVQMSKYQSSQFMWCNQQLRSDVQMGGCKKLDNQSFYYRE